MYLLRYNIKLLLYLHSFNRDKVLYYFDSNERNDETLHSEYNFKLQFYS